MDERVFGVFLMVGSICGLILYGILMFFGDLAFLVLKVTAFTVVGSLLIMAAWGGFMLFTTPKLPESDINDLGVEGDDEGL